MLGRKRLESKSRLLLRRGKQARSLRGRRADMQKISMNLAANLEIIPIFNINLPQKGGVMRTSSFSRHACHKQNSDCYNLNNLKTQHVLMPKTKLYLKYHTAFRQGHVCRRHDERWSKRVLEWRPRLGKRNVGRPPARCRTGLEERDGQSIRVEKGWRGVCLTVGENALKKKKKIRQGAHKAGCFASLYGNANTLTEERASPMVTSGTGKLAFIASMGYAKGHDDVHHQRDGPRGYTYSQVFNGKNSPALTFTLRSQLIRPTRHQTSTASSFGVHYGVVDHILCEIK
ncbi:hypothetical protein MSG28_009346 [Choristoneura fumiferana]|uniref:Uncharacterized protein n=1 Tax=Choristoneura fumiferana TaxID=7141 RepID=A0ACC0KX75_CHOFU|nr:hypothetical protein MSG28_009346 [Choristoneura fumiferana]